MKKTAIICQIINTKNMLIQYVSHKEIQGMPIKDLSCWQKVVCVLKKEKFTNTTCWQHWHSNSNAIKWTCINKDIYTNLADQMVPMKYFTHLQGFFKKDCKMHLIILVCNFFLHILHCIQKEIKSPYRTHIFTVDEESTPPQTQS